MELQPVLIWKDKNVNPIIHFSVLFDGWTVKEQQPYILVSLEMTDKLSVRCNELCPDPTKWNSIDIN